MHICIPRNGEPLSQLALTAPLQGEPVSVPYRGAGIRALQGI